MEFRGATRTVLGIASWPVGKLVISNDRLEASAFFRLATIKKEDVLNIEVVPGFWPSIKIWNSPEAFPHIQFWSFRMPRVLRALELHGYNVKKKPNQSSQPTPQSRRG
jgi:hypothetical protein